MGGAKVIDQASLTFITSHYQETEDVDRMIKIYETLLKHDKDNVTYLINLAKFYAMKGDYNKAEEAAKKVIEIDPSQQVNAETFLRSIGR